MGKTKKDFMDQRSTDKQSKQEVEIISGVIQQMKNSAEEWEKIKYKKSPHWWPQVWKYIYNLRSRK